MPLFRYTILAVAIISIGLSAKPSHASDKSDTTKTIETCLNMGSGVPTALIYRACIAAFDVAINEAQKTDANAIQSRDLLWMQASKSAAIALLAKVKLDQKVETQSCKIARGGLQSDSQISAGWKEKFSELRSVNTLTPIFNLCKKSGYYDNQKKSVTWADADKAFREKDLDSAEQILIQLGNEGHLKAQMTLGLLYQNGTSFTQSFTKAMFWYKKYAQTDSAKTMPSYGLATNVVGMMYYQGTEVDKSPSAAFPWFEKSANAGNGSSMVILGVMYAKGESVTKNRETAIYWLKKAKSLNGPDASSAQAMLNKLGVTGG